MPPLLLLRVAVALVWLYEGLWCKILGRMPHQQSIVESVPALSGPFARFFLSSLGYLECAFAVWVLTGLGPWWAALAQTVILVAMNSVGLSFARQHIHDPIGMVLKNFVLILLLWVAAGYPA